MSHHIQVRSSTHSKTGFVAVHQFRHPLQAGAFAQEQAVSLGHSVFVRRLPGGLWGVPIPCPPPSTAAQVVKQVAAILRVPAPPPGGQCIAYTRSGSQCRRRASHGHYCQQHYSLVG